MKSLITFLILIVLIVLNKINANNKRQLIEEEKRLIQKLLTNYDKKTRPSDTSIIKFSLVTRIQNFSSNSKLRLRL
jgi:ABC-type microcin C transport system permease subunit YejE